MNRYSTNEMLSSVHGVCSFHCAFEVWSCQGKPSSLICHLCVLGFMGFMGQSRLWAELLFCICTHWWRHLQEWHHARLGQQRVVYSGVCSTVRSGNIWDIVYVSHWWVVYSNVCSITIRSDNTVEECCSWLRVWALPKAVHSHPLMTSSSLV